MSVQEQARDVVHAALHAHVDTAEQQAAVVVAALAERGLLAVDTGPAVVGVMDAAVRLGEASRHPRYTVPHGFHRLRQSSTDVEVAYAQALRNQPSEMRPSLDQWRRTLLDALTAEGKP